jgi:hypothetical protein
MKQENNQNGRKGINSAALSISNELKLQLSAFSGTSHYYRHVDGHPLIFTQGVQFLIHKTNAKWLLDLIFSLYTHKDNFLKKNEFIAFKLVVLIHEEQPTAMFTVDDGNDHILYAKAITYTDFPIDSLKLFLVNNVLMLPSEY